MYKKYRKIHIAVPGTIESLLFKTIAFSLFPFFSVRRGKRSGDERLLSWRRWKSLGLWKAAASTVGNPRRRQSYWNHLNHLDHLSYLQFAIITTFSAAAAAAGSVRASLRFGLNVSVKVGVGSNGWWFRRKGALGMVEVRHPSTPGSPPMVLAKIRAIQLKTFVKCLSQ